VSQSLQTPMAKLLISQNQFQTFALFYFENLRSDGLAPKYQKRKIHQSQIISQHTTSSISTTAIDFNRCSNTRYTTIGWRWFCTISISITTTARTCWWTCCPISPCCPITIYRTNCCTIAKHSFHCRARA